MTATAIVKQSDLKRMAAVATESNVCIELETTLGTVRVFPNIHTSASQQNEELAPKKRIRI